MALMGIFVIFLVLGLLVGGIAGHAMGWGIAVLSGPLRRRLGRLEASTVTAILGSLIVGVVTAAIVFVADFQLSADSLDEARRSEVRFYATEQLVVLTIASGLGAFGASLLTSWLAGALLGVRHPKGGALWRVLGTLTGLIASVTFATIPALYIAWPGGSLALIALGFLLITVVEGGTWGWLIARRIQVLIADRAAARNKGARA